ncbi:ABC transporter permease [Streptomyces sp. NPDC002870]|uniref:ABC transporter permease n=1 Tax=Streptomyces sp. NPDC002870 TaxID=3364666 RepID=UPI0036CCFAAC
MSIDHTEEATAEGTQGQADPAPERRTAPAGEPGSDRKKAERLSAFRELSRVMYLVFARDKAAVFFLIVFPVLFLLLFGTLFRGETTGHAKVAEVGSVQVLDAVRGKDRAELDKVLSITRVTDEADALAKVRKGEYDALIKQGSGGTVVLHYSATDQVKAGTVRGAVNALLERANVAATGKPPTYTLSSQTVEDESLKPIQYITPGLLGWAIASGAVFSTALTLVSLRRKRVLRRMRLSPISAGSVVASRIGVTMFIAFSQTALFLGVSTLPFFGLRLSGNWWLILPLIACATLSLMSIGLLVGAVTKTEESAGGLAQLLVLPMSFLSGSFFTLDDSPGWLQGIASVMPLRYLVTGSESVLSRGGGVMDVLPTMGGMLLFGAVMTAIAWRFFSWDDT